MDSSWRSLEDHHHHHHQEEEEWSHDHKVTNHDIVSNDSPECHILMSVQSCALCIMTDILKYLMTTGMPMQHAGLASQDNHTAPTNPEEEARMVVLFLPN